MTSFSLPNAKEDIDMMEQVHWKSAKTAGRWTKADTEMLQELHLFSQKTTRLRGGLTKVHGFLMGGYREHDAVCNCCSDVCAVLVHVKAQK